MLSKMTTDNALSLLRHFVEYIEKHIDEIIGQLNQISIQIWPPIVNGMSMLITKGFCHITKYIY